jgi:hypothetical protein
VPLLRTSIRRVTGSVPTRRRLVIAVGIGLLQVVIHLVQSLAETKPSDFAQAWFAAHALLRGQDPYALIGPGLSFDWLYPFVYPLPAALLAMPFAALPNVTFASACFTGLGAGALAWALMRNGYWPLIALASYAVVFSFRVAQWPPLFAAALVVPAFGITLAAKPTIGAAIFIARPSWWAIGGGVALLAASFALEPSWLPHWLDAVVRTKAMWAPGEAYRMPIALPGGALVLACLARWRRADARLVLALACVPQTFWPYDLVPLFLVPQMPLECVALALLSAIPAYAAISTSFGPHAAETLQRIGQASLWAIYLPCVLMVLRRPNEGTVPAWLEKRIAVWPAWLRGRTLADA